MTKMFGWLLGGILLVILCIWMYAKRSTSAYSANGVVTPLDSNSSASPSDTSTNIDGETSRSAPPPQAAAGTLPPPAATPQQTQPPPMQPAQAQSAPTANPTSDTFAPSAPNGMAFGGKGRFQWYRQGNITWRIDTVSGATCIDFATMDEWSKPIVYSHGCSNS